MVTSPWSVSIISTDYDLKDLRNTVIDKIIKSKFKILAFDKLGYPVEPHVHSHDACLNALKIADIVILIIDKRYGGLYVGTGKESITEKEYDEAIMDGKIFIPCIRNEAWQERYHLNSSIKQSGLKKKEARAKYKPCYVNNWKVLDFIEKVHKADKDNFAIFFNEPEDLNQKLIDRLKGITRFILELLVKAQMQFVKDMKTITGMCFSLGDVLDKGYFIEPPLESISGPSFSGQNISESILKLSNKNIGIALLGDPGSGKSTLLAKLFLERANYSIKNKSYELPFILSLRSRGADYKFNFNIFLEQSFKEFLNKTLYPKLNLVSITPIFYIDGFDELSEDIAGINLKRISESDFFSSPFVMACRSRFASDYLQTDTTFGSKMSYIIKLKSWDKEIAWGYVKRFCTIQRRNDLLKDLKNNFFSKYENLEIIENPLLLTLFLWIVKESKMRLPLDVKDQRTLFNKCLKIFAHRELPRIIKDNTSLYAQGASLILKIWEIAVWEIYRTRFDNKTLNLNQLIALIKKNLSDIENILVKEIFTGFFDIRPSGEVTGFLHEQFLEHLVANSVANGIKDYQYPFPSSLEYIIRPEINRIIKSIWQTFDEDSISQTLKNLWDIYINTLSKKDSINILIRNQATYYIGRINNEKAIDKLREAKGLETEILVKLSIGFGLIKSGDFKTEDESLKLLKQKNEWDTGNRGYHLVYYHDWQIKSEKPPYYDPENINWKNTLQALLRHVASKHPQHIALRRIELFTIKRFIESRGQKGPLTNEIMDKLKNAINSGSNHPNNPNFNSLVKEEFHDLESSWQKLIG